MADLDITVGLSGMPAIANQLSTFRREAEQTAEAVEKVANAREVPLSSMYTTARPFREAVDTQRRLSDEFDRSSLSLGRLITRFIAYRLLWEGLKLTVDLIKTSFDMTKEIQDVQTDLQNLSTAGTNVDQTFKSLRETSYNTGTDIKEIGAALSTLEQGGRTTEQAANAMEGLAKAAAVTHQPLQKIAQILTDLHYHQASIKEMFSVQGLLSPATRQAVEAYDQMTRDAPIITMEMQRQVQLQERAHYWEMQQQNARVGLMQKLGYTSDMFEEFKIHPASPIPQNMLHSNMFGQLAGPQVAVWDQWQRGARQIRSELGITQTDMQKLLRQGKLDANDLFEAGRRNVEQEQKRVQEAQQDRSYERKATQMQTNLDLQAQISKEIQNTAMWADKWAATQKTISQEQQTFINGLKMSLGEGASGPLKDFFARPEVPLPAGSGTATMTVNGKTFKAGVPVAPPPPPQGLIPGMETPAPGSLGSKIDGFFMSLIDGIKKLNDSYDKSNTAIFQMLAP